MVTVPTTAEILDGGWAQLWVFINSLPLLLSSLLVLLSLLPPSYCTTLFLHHIRLLLNPSLRSGSGSAGSFPFWSGRSQEADGFLRIVGVNFRPLLISVQANTVTNGGGN